MDPVETSDDVLRLANLKKTAPKLEKIAKAWNLDYIQIYRDWYPLGCSRNFLIPLVELSRLSGEYERARQILLDCKRKRTEKSKSAAKGWAIVDVKLAVSKAKELGLARDIPWSGLNEGMTQRSHARESMVTRSGGTRKRPRDGEDSMDTGRIPTSKPHETSVHSAGRSTEVADMASTPAQWQSGAAGALVSSLQARVRGGGRQTTTLTHIIAPNHLPPTPSSATSVAPGPCSIRMLDNPRSSSSPTWPAQSAEDDNAGHSATSAGESARDNHQPVLPNAAKHEWSNDDRMDILLRTFNPDPSIWYIVPTQILEAGEGIGITGIGLRDAGTSPKMVLIPLRGSDEAQRILVVFDRMRAHASIFDAEGCDNAAKLAWSTTQALLTKIGILQGEASMEPYSFPSMLPNEGVSSGILLIIAALHKLHERPTEIVSPKLWRCLLAGFFPDGRDSPQARFEKLLADLTKRTCSEEKEGVGIEQNIDDAESLRVAQATVESYAGQAKLLLQMTEAQLRSEEKRSKLAKLHEWLLARPPDIDDFTSEVAALEANVVSQLSTLPEISEWCGRQLHSIEISCQHAVEECEQTTRFLEARRKAIVQTADANHKRLGEKLVSLFT
jgi:hypothetical protein